MLPEKPEKSNRTVMVVVSVAEFPFSSVASHVTMVSPGGNCCGESWVMVTLNRSNVLGSLSLTGVSKPAAVTVLFSGGLMIGGVVSSTVMLTSSTLSVCPLLTLNVIRWVPSGSSTSGDWLFAVPKSPDQV